MSINSNGMIGDIYYFNTDSSTFSINGKLNRILELFSQEAKLFTIHYKDKTSYTIKPLGKLTINSKEGKHNRVLSVEYLRKPRLELDTEGIMIKELGGVYQEMTLNAQDIKSIEIKQDDRIVEITKFK